jgi:O-antigen ligase
MAAKSFNAGNMNMRLNKISEYLIYAIIFLLPWQTRYIWHYGTINNGPWEYGTFAVYGTEVLLWLAIIIFAAVNFFRKGFWNKIKTPTDRKYFFVWPLAFFLLLGLSLLASRSFAVSYNFIFHLLEAMCLAAVMAMLQIDFKKAVLALWSAGIVQSLLAIWQFLAQKVYASKWLGMAEQTAKVPGTAAVEFGDERWLRAYGSFSWPNALGIFLAVALLLGLWLYVNDANKRHKIYISVGQIFIAAGLFFSFSRSAWLALAAGVFIFIIAAVRQNVKNIISQIWKQAVLFLALAAVLLVIFYPVFAARFNLNNRLEQKSISERRAQYLESWQMIGESPWLGVGPGAYTHAAFLHNPVLGFWQYQPAHNIYMLMAAEIGLPAATLLLMFFIFLVSRTARQQPYYLSVLCAVFVFGLFDHWLWSLYGGMLFFWVILGISLLPLESNKTPISSS